MATNFEDTLVISASKLTHASVGDAFAKERVKVEVVVGQKAQREGLHCNTIPWLQTHKLEESLLLLQHLPRNTGRSH